MPGQPKEPMKNSPDREALQQQMQADREKREALCKEVVDEACKTYDCELVPQHITQGTQIVSASVVIHAR
jgi:hypothetical protein